jgi:hypothetical protein
MAVLTEDQVRAIHKDKRPIAKIAQEYGVARQTIYNIKRGATWKHLGLRKLRKVKNEPIKQEKTLLPPIINRQVPTSDPKEKDTQFNGFFSANDNDTCNTRSGDVPREDHRQSKP